MWQPVDIELEQYSRNFVSHMHDPNKCDLIVCWEHNWPECPLEVIELKTEFERLQREGRKRRKKEDVPLEPFNMSCDQKFPCCWMRWSNEEDDQCDREWRDAPDEIEPRLLLVQYIRDVLNLTGTHVGCETSLCGACTVMVDGQAVKSCTMLAAQADGSTVTTIEGLAQGGELHPVQNGFWEHHGLQCGYCTPGMIMAAAQILQRNPDPTDEEIRHGLEGNLCRCTGYQNIVQAVQCAAKKMKSKSVAR